MPGGRMERDPVPAYHRISLTMKERIARGTYPIAAQLPTEDALMREFAVSRHTIRAALQQLVQQGLVRRQAGKGSFVLRQDDAGQHWVAQSLEDMVDRGFRGSLQGAAMTLLRARSKPGLALDFAAEAGAQLACFSWLRAAESGPYAFARVYVRAEHAARFPADWIGALRTSRLLHLLEASCSVRAQRVRQTVTAVPAEKDVARRLRVPPGVPLLRLERRYLDAAGAVLEFAVIHGRPDRYQQTVELFRGGNTASG